MGKVLVLAKYLVKNYFLNPLILPIRRNKAVALLIIAGIVSLVLFIAILPPPKDEPKAEEGPSLRQVLHGLGLNRERVEWILTIMSSILLYYLLLRSSSPLIAFEEAEIDVLLAQPIEMREYFAAKEIVNLVNMIWILLIFIGLSPLIVELTGSPFRGALAVVSLGVMFLYIEGIVGVVWNLKARGGSWSRSVQAALYVLLVTGIIHSLMIGGVSPVIALPVWIVVKPLVCSVSLSCDLSSLLLYSLAAFTVTLSLFLMAYLTSDALTPEMISILRTEPKTVKWIEFTSKERVPLEHLVIPDMRSKGNLVILVSVPVVGLIGHLLGGIFGIVGDLGPLLGALGGALIPLFAPYLLTSMGEDFIGLWIYRVYSIDMRPFGRALIIKYYYRMFISLAVVAAFVSGMTGSLVPLEFLGVFSSAIALAVFLMTLPMIYFLPRRRVVRWNPLGYYSLDSLVEGLVLLPAAVVVVSYLIVALYLTGVGWGVLSLISISSLLVSAFLIQALGNQLGDLLYSVDVAG